MKIKKYYLIIFPVLLTLASCKQSEHFDVFSEPSFEFLEQIIDDLPQNSLVALDVDETIFCLDRAPFNEPSQFCDLIDEPAACEADADRLNWLLHKVIPAVIDPSIVGLIERLQQKGIKVIALTAGGHGKYGCISDLAEYRRHMLQAIGIHFEKSFPLRKIVQLSKLGKRGYAPLFYYGILFSSPCTKGPALAQFLKEMKLKPSLLLFVDNDEGNVEEIAQTANDLHIPGVGVVYKGLDYVPEEVFRVYNQKVNFLFKNNRWLSDSEAKELIRQHNA